MRRYTHLVHHHGSGISEVRARRQLRQLGYSSSEAGSSGRSGATPTTGIQLGDSGCANARGYLGQHRERVATRRAVGASRRGGIAESLDAGLLHGGDVA